MKEVDVYKFNETPKRKGELQRRQKNERAAFEVCGVSQAQRIAAETAEEREARLRAICDNHTQRVTSETEEQRESRLQEMRDYRMRRLASETDEARLQQTRENQLRRCTDDNEDVDRRRQESRERQRRHRELERLRPHTALTRAHAEMANFHSKLETLEISKCNICHEKSHGKKTMLQETQGSVCTRCKKDKHTPKIYSPENNMDPGPVPPELFGLTQVEEMLVSAVIPMMSIYRLPHGQYGYSCHVINFPQDVLSFATTLPRLPSQLDVIVVRKEGVARSHRDFRVRRYVVERALRYLVTNNKYYQANDVRIDEDALAKLPADGSLSDTVPVVLENVETTRDDKATPTSDVTSSGCPIQSSCGR